MMFHCDIPLIKQRTSVRTEHFFFYRTFEGGSSLVITKTCLNNFDPLKPHFYKVKLGFIGVYIIFFLFQLKNIDYGHSLKPPRQGGSNEYMRSMFRAEICKKKI